MPGKSAQHDIELIIEDIGGGGGGKPPQRDGGDDDAGGGNHHDASPSSQRRYFTALAVGIVAILMFFMALASAYIVRRGSSAEWTPIHVPPVLWLNTFILLLSSATLEFARRKLAKGDLAAFRNLWMVTTIFGVLFLAGQYVGWRQLQAQGIFIATNPASSFFYVFTGTHAVHLLGGVAALVYVAVRKFDQAKISRSAAAEVTSYYWHFMDALWVFLLALIYVGR